MTNDIQSHYKKLFETHGISHNALQMSSKESQYARFKVLGKEISKEDSLVDIGCGFGDLYDYLSNERDYKGEYTGLDFVKEFIDVSTEKYKNNSKVNFDVFDVTKNDLPKGKDWYVTSGMFNNKMDDNKDFMLLTLRKMFEACNKGIAFNAMSTYVDYFADELYYVDPRDTFDFCKKELSKKVILKHDYVVKENSIPFEFTMYVFK